MQIITTAMESSMVIPQKTRDFRTVIWSSDTAPGHLSKKNVRQDTAETPVHRCSLQLYHNSQALEATQMPYN
jgi:hypothetical protein